MKSLKLFFILLCSFSFVAQAGNNYDLATEILVYINQYRVQHGLSELVMNNELITQATRHSLDMANHAVPFGHDGFNRRIGYLYRSIPNATAGAENVAYNYKTAKSVVDGWISSRGHRKNILGKYNLTGIGLAQDKQGKYYYTQIFLYKSQEFIPK